MGRSGANVQLPYSVKNFGATGDGSTDDTAAINAAIAAIGGAKKLLYFPAGTYMVQATSGTHVNLSGAAFGIKGDGDATCIKAIAGQSAPVLDFTGYNAPANTARKRAFTDFRVEGDGTAGTAKKGIVFPGLTGVRLENVEISNTGGVALDVSGTILSDFISVGLIQPVSANANNVPYLYGAGAVNANRFIGIGFRNLNASNGEGAAGVMQLVDNGTFTPSGNLLSGCWFENQRIPTAGSLINIAGNYNVIADCQYFDLNIVAAATNTALIVLSVPGVSDQGGNEVRGLIPGNAFNTTRGVLLKQSRNRVIGVKGQDGKNVEFASGVNYSHVNLGGQWGGTLMSNAAVIDNSGTITNTVVDNNAGPGGTIDIAGLGAGTTAGTKDDYAIIQAAINALPSTGGKLVFKGGLIYRVDTPLTLISNVTFEGPGTGARLHGTNGLFTWSSHISKCRFVGMYLTAAAGHIFTSTAGSHQFNFTDCTLSQAGTGYSIWKHDMADSFIEHRFEGCDLWISASATVPGFDIRGTGGALAGNSFHHCRLNGQTNTAVPFFKVSEDNTTYVYDWEFDQISVEQCGGGFLKAYSAQGWKLDGIYGWDQTTYADDFVYFGKAPTSGILSRRIAVNRVYRRGGTLSGGKFDVNLDPAGVAANSACEVTNISTSTLTDALVQYPAGTRVVNAGGPTLVMPGVVTAPNSPLSLMDPLASGGEGIFDRRMTANGIAGSSGQLILLYGTAQKTELITQLAMYTGSTAAATNTLIRYGIYTVDPTTGDLTMVGSTPTDLTLLQAAQTRYPKALSASFTKVAGLRYAVGYLVVGGTQPNSTGVAASVSTVDAIYATGGATNRFAATVNGLSDLPTTVSAGSLVNTRRGAYFEILP